MRVAQRQAEAKALEALQKRKELELEVTERKRLEGELKLRADELVNADHRKDEFLAMLGHELRNPLAPIRNALEIVHMKGSSEAQPRMGVGSHRPPSSTDDTVGRRPSGSVAHSPGKNQGFARKPRNWLRSLSMLWRAAAR